MDIIIKLTAELVIVVIAFILGRYIIPSIKTRISDDSLQNILSWTTILVKAAENMITEKGAGKVKYEYVSQALSEKLKEYNVDLSENDIKNIIEHAVYVMNNTKKEK